MDLVVGELYTCSLLNGRARAFLVDFAIHSPVNRAFISAGDVIMYLGPARSKQMNKFWSLTQNRLIYTDHTSWLKRLEIP